MTESEREWLEDRENARYHFSCQWCSQYDPMLIMPDKQDVPCMWYVTCPCNTNNYDYKDALEFSERVAVKLARMSVDALLPCFQTNGDCPYTNPNCAWCRLIVARLSIEEEMNVDQE